MITILDVMSRVMWWLIGFYVFTSMGIVPNEPEGLLGYSIGFVSGWIIIEIVFAIGRKLEQWVKKDTDTDEEDEDEEE
jgi:hypothetical protein